MPNGTYGGVRGEAGDGFTYSIVCRKSTPRFGHENS